MHFADRPVDVVVLEVGMGGRWDATNVADAQVAVVTNVGLDHVEFLGPTRAHVAGEKAGVVKPGAILVLGDEDPDLLPIFAGQDPAEIWLSGRDYACVANRLAVGGRSLDLRTPAGDYEEVWLDLHGAHQGRNFASALAAVEAFFGAPLDEKLVREAAATVSSPGRMEIVRGAGATAGRGRGQRPPGRPGSPEGPVVILDGAKNLEGAAASAAALAEEFGSTHRIVMVVGMLRGAGKEPVQMLEALGANSPMVRLLIACPAPSPRAVPAAEVVEAALSLGCEVLEAPGVPEAVEMALADAGEGDVIVVTGSLYVVGAARAFLAAG
jgi:dihydrofolate synthase/folylpolyglutamate synthase